MKRIVSVVLMLIIMMSIFSGCGAANNKAKNTKDIEITTQLNAMKEQNKKPKEMFEYLNQNIKGMNKAAASEAAGILVNTLEEYETTYNEQLFTGDIPDLMYKYFEFVFDYNKIESIKEPELKKLLYDITLGGFKIVDTEGTFMVIVDYDSLKTFNEYLDDELKVYIDIMSLRYSDPVSIDASIMINQEELEKRIIQMEDYIKNYDNPQRKEIMLSLYFGNMMVYMSGTENTPIFDLDTGAISSDMFKKFETDATTYKDAIFGKVISKYVEVLKQEGFANTEKVQGFILNIDIIVNEELAKVQKK